MATKHYKYDIVNDESPESPRTWDNLGTLAIASSRWSFGDAGLSHNCDSIQEAFEEHLAENDLTIDKVIWLPVYGYSHGGLTINTTGFSCSWDSGKLGFIYVSKANALSEYGGKRVGKKLTERVEEYLRGEIQTMDQYLNGEVYGYKVLEFIGESDDDQDDEDLWEEIDSCWGYYGREYCEEEAQAVIESHKKQDALKAEKAIAKAAMIQTNVAFSFALEGGFA